MAATFTIQDLPAAERPRERLIEHGVAALSSPELLALVLGRGVRGESVLMTAQKLLVQFGSLRGVVAASLAELQTIKGVGIAKAAQLKACLEIAHRVLHHEAQEEVTRNESAALASPRDVPALLRAKLRDFRQEHYFVVSLDNRNRVLGIDEVAIGTANTSIVHPRETFAAAIDRHATHIIISHNHPSGDPSPSEADISFTKRLSEAGQLMGIELLDHIIITKTKLFSFREQGLIS